MQSKSLQDQISAQQLHAVQYYSFDPSNEVCNVLDDTSIVKDVSVQNSDELIPVNAVLSQNIPVGPGFPYGGSQYQYKFMPRFRWNQQNQTGQAQNNNQGQSSNQNSNQAQWGRQEQNNQNRGGQANSNQGWNNQGQGQQSNQGWNNSQERQQKNGTSEDHFETYIAQQSVAMKAMQEQIRQLAAGGQQGKLPDRTPPLVVRSDGDGQI